MRVSEEKGRGAYLVVEDEALVGVLHELVHRERGVVRLHHRVRHLGGGVEVGGGSRGQSVDKQAFLLHAPQHNPQGSRPAERRHPPPTHPPYNAAQPRQGGARTLGEGMME